ncbi:MAG: DUF7344 domain-containing protein [Halobacteriota archaeon]
MSQTDSTRLSQDEAFDLLSSPRRRYVIHYLRRSGEPVELGNLADEVAAWENETPVEELTSQQRKRVYVSLYQTHIPKLEEFGIVEYDGDAGTVRVTDQIDEIGRYLSDESEEVRWDAYYLVLAVASALIYATIALEIVALSPAGEMVVAGAIMAAFLAVASWHWMKSKKRNGESISSLLDLED